MTTTHALSFKKPETRNPEPPGLVCTLAVASTTEQALGATCFPGHLPQAEERYVTDCCAAQVQSTGRWARLVRSARWRGAHQALAQTSTVEARHPGVLDRLRSSWRRSARQDAGGPDAPHSLAGPDAHAQAISACAKRGGRCPSLPSERHRSPMHTTQLVAPIRVGDVRPSR